VARLIVSRLMGAALVLFVVFCTTFLLFRAAPGGPFQSTGRPRPPEVTQLLNQKYGLNDSAWLQFWRYLRTVLRGDFGPSFGQPGTSVSSIVTTTLPVSLHLGAGAMVLATVVGIPLGVFGARHRGRARDRVVTTATAAALAIPDFVAVSLLVIFLAVYRRILPPQGWDGLLAKTAIIPLIALAFGPAALLARFTRSALLEVGSADFVVAARARGLSRRTVERAVLRNATVPILGIGGLVLAALVGGSFFVESAYNIPGIGRESVKGIVARDYPLIMATVLVYAAIVISINLLVDIAVLVIDPRLAGSDD
jgi:oligopeptide transport system permease protein